MYDDEITIFRLLNEEYILECEAVPLLGHKIPFSETQLAKVILTQFSRNRSQKRVSSDCEREEHR